MGFEPTCNCLQGRCLPCRATVPLFFVSIVFGLFQDQKEKWYSRQGSNLKRNVRSVSCFQLHHRSTGESGRNRTSNLRIKSALLCRIELRTQVVRPVGIEPTTPRLKVECAANCATDGHCLALPFTGFAVHLWLPLFWCDGLESNQRSQVFQTCALPTELPPHVSFPTLLA